MDCTKTMVSTTSNTFLVEQLGISKIKTENKLKKDNTSIKSQDTLITRMLRNKNINTTFC